MQPMEKSVPTLLDGQCARARACGQEWGSWGASSPNMEGTCLFSQVRGLEIPVLVQLQSCAAFFVVLIGPSCFFPRLFAGAGLQLR